MPLRRHAGAEQLLITVRQERCCAPSCDLDFQLQLRQRSFERSSPSFSSLGLRIRNGVGERKGIGLAQGLDEGGGLNQILLSLGGVPRPFLRDDELMGSVP